MLEDWRALCKWLEDQPYNADYNPRGRGAYLTMKPYSPYRTIRVRDESTPPHPIFGYLMKEIPNPKIAEEREKARRSRMITAERRRMDVIFWSTGHGWRLRKDWRERLEAEAQALEAEAQGEP